MNAPPDVIEQSDRRPGGNVNCHASDPNSIQTNLLLSCLPLRGLEISAEEEDVKKALTDVSLIVFLTPTNAEQGDISICANVIR